MTSQTSLPVVQPQPSDPFYPPQSLLLFRDYDRAGFQKAFGQDAPSYDPSRRPKSWFDTSATGRDSDPVTYHYIDTDKPGQATVNTLTLSVLEARSVNLEGTRSYPKYVVAPTAASVLGPGGDSQPLNAASLATMEEARLMAHLLQLPDAAIEQQSLGGPFSLVYPANEPRRQYTIQWKDGTALTVALLINQMYANGIGAPGHWDLSVQSPRWISELEPAAPATLPSMPRPIRPLLQNEAIATDIFGSQVIYRTDKSSVYTQQASAGGLTAEEAMTIARIDTNLQALLRWAGLNMS